MKIPNAERALLAPEKLRDYLLDVQHKRGGPKARLLYAFGYRREEWERLRDDLRVQHLPMDVDRTIQTDYGTRYEIHGPLSTPVG